MDVSSKQLVQNERMICFDISTASLLDTSKGVNGYCPAQFQQSGLPRLSKRVGVREPAKRRRTYFEFCRCHDVGRGRNVQLLESLSGVLLVGWHMPPFRCLALNTNVRHSNREKSWDP